MAEDRIDQATVPQRRQVEDGQETHGPGCRHRAPGGAEGSTR